MDAMFGCGLLSKVPTYPMFDALAEGGSLTMPLQDTFWGARFGMLADAFGIRRMFNGQTNS